MAKGIRIGDIIEIATNKGFVYGQYTHEHTQPPRMGSLIRILGSFFEERPPDFGLLAESISVFKTFVPLARSVNLKLVSIVANEPIPNRESQFPVFRNGTIDPASGKVENWWFWDGNKEWRVGRITSEQKRMPILELVTVPELVKRIESGWTPETDPYT